MLSPGPATASSNQYCRISFTDGSVSTFVKGRVSVFSIFTTAGLILRVSTDPLHSGYARSPCLCDGPHTMTPVEAAASSTARCSCIRLQFTLVLPHVSVIALVENHNPVTNAYLDDEIASTVHRCPLCYTENRICSLIPTPGIISFTLLNCAAFKTASIMQSNSPASPQSGSAVAPLPCSHRECDATCVVR
jgi:hypothetical protein